MKTNDKIVNVRGKGLTELIAPKATRIDCSDNQLTELIAPKAIDVYCEINKIKKLIAPNADRIDCYDNNLKELIAPNASMIFCMDNQLKKISASRVFILCCQNNPLEKIDIPHLKIFHYCKNGIHMYGNRIEIGCRSKTIEQWDEWFAGTEEYETKRGTDEFRLIEKAYRLVRDNIKRNK